MNALGTVVDGAAGAGNETIGLAGVTICTGLCCWADNSGVERR